ncbi:MAG: hypothetical protein ACE5IC_01040 [Candidatus Brocadiales bacterium]
MRIPLTTYRLQFNPSFRFKEAKNIIDYLHGTGISDIYAFPIFKAKRGSLHGHDVVGPNQLNLAVKTRYRALVAGDKKIEELPRAIG